MGWFSRQLFDHHCQHFSMRVGPHPHALSLSDFAAPCSLLAASQLARAAGAADSTTAPNPLQPSTTTSIFRPSELPTFRPSHFRNHHRNALADADAHRAER